jgi:hypothetical protein
MTLVRVNGNEDCMWEFSGEYDRWVIYNLPVEGPYLVEILPTTMATSWQDEYDGARIIRAFSWAETHTVRSEWGAYVRVKNEDSFAPIEVEGRTWIPWTESGMSLVYTAYLFGPAPTKVDVYEESDGYTVKALGLEHSFDKCLTSLALKQAMCWLLQEIDHLTAFAKRERDRLHDLANPPSNTSRFHLIG